ncbi:MAG: DHA2 family efflux MFS transporter permease subunit [Actinomycetota bacterium]|nr:DHA2 family efflux MFS transporter permease subunit [Actinomycetota bacterium]
MPAQGSAGAGLRMGTPGGRRLLLATVLGSGMALLDTTVVNLALPTIGSDLGADVAGLQWTVTGYLLPLASLILLGGSLGDRFGRRRVFGVGVVWFAVASLLCALAPTVELLVAARALQGVGGALLTPGSLALLSASFDPDDRGPAIGAWSGLTGVAAAAGPFVGGALLAVDWRLVFVVNLPVAVVVAVALRRVSESADEDAPRRVDVTGALTATTGLAGVTFALIEAPGRGLGPLVLTVGTVGLAALAAFVLVERRSPHPMLPLGLFASRQFTAANLVTAAVYAALGGVFLLLVVHLQVVAGYPALAAGLCLLPVTAAMLTLSARWGALAARTGPRLPMAGGPAVAALGVLLLLRIGPGADPLVDVLPAVAVFGLGLSATVAPLTATALGAVRVRYAGVASGVNNAVARAAGLLAVAVLPVVSGLTGSDYTDPAAFAAGFRVAMGICAALLALGGVLAAVLVSDAPDAVTGRRRTTGSA